LGLGFGLGLGLGLGLGFGFSVPVGWAQPVSIVPENAAISPAVTSAITDFLVILSLQDVLFEKKKK
jgi:hypothetical protein